jgi:glycosyltransferase involved in cell wall biosynthesis
VHDHSWKTSGDSFESSLVSVIITNYNYARFLREAIASALNETYPNVEVIVVDDGSTDDSREVIASYGDRIVPVLKDNGGQASATNVGFAASNGEIAIFLDADDILLPETARRVATAFEAHPGVAKVQYRLRLIDVYGRPMAELEPPRYQPMLSGDLRAHILKFGWYAWPSTSGNAFASAILRQILPIPEDIYRVTPDIYLCNLSAMYGSVVSLDEVGTLYRVHGENNYYLGSTSTTNVANIRREIIATADSNARQRRLFHTLYSVDVQEVGRRNLLSLTNRVTSKKLDARNHPFREGLLWLCVRGCVFSITDPDTARLKRVVYALWFLGVLLTPRSVAKLLIDARYQPEKRGRVLTTVLDFLQREPDYRRNRKR